MPHRLVVVLVAAAIIAPCRAVLSAAEPARFGMIEVKLSGRTLEGGPLAWDRQQVHLLGRDGQLWKFAPNAVEAFAKTAGEFRAYSPSELRAALLRELGNDYEVSGTGHYLIAHRRGQRDRWAERFEDLYRSFVHYFAVRGLDPAPPRFPLVGIVRADRAEFDQQAAAEGVSARGVEGYYDPTTNRINIYDMGRADGVDWRHNAAVLIHEATHQTAFNTGIHSRYAPTPRWLAEGLAMLFEAPGVYDSHAYPDSSDRVNRGRLRDFQRGVAPRHRPELLQSIVASDELFRVSPGEAYAEAWALSFFLVETEPAKYVRYLRQTALRRHFVEYSARERTADFTEIFGSDWRMLDARLLRFMAGLK
jgi:hypothetical protein